MWRPLWNFSHSQDVLIRHTCGPTSPPRIYISLRKGIILIIYHQYHYILLISQLINSISSYLINIMLSYIIMYFIFHNWLDRAAVQWALPVPISLGGKVQFQSYIIIIIICCKYLNWLIVSGWQDLAGFRRGQKWPWNLSSSAYLQFSRQMRSFCA